ncbi:MAG: DUF2007 domain-containing protein [Paludibacteraceae bacterium]|nr:DUF2007 domain-containing protein [Paludibacteraceae bacterium]
MTTNKIPENLCELASFPTEIEATMALQELQNAGIEAFLSDSIMGEAFHVATGGVRLYVQTADLERAKDLLGKA